MSSVLSGLHYCFLLYGGFYRQDLFNLSTPIRLIYFASWLDWAGVGSITASLVQDEDRPHADLFFPSYSFNYKHTYHGEVVSLVN